MNNKRYSFDFRPRLPYASCPIHERYFLLSTAVGKFATKPDLKPTIFPREIFASNSDGNLETTIWSITRWRRNLATKSGSAVKLVSYRRVGRETRRANPKNRHETIGRSRV